MNKKLEKFSPLAFLAPLGAGGISIAFFAFLNYTFDHGKGLVNIAQTHELLSGAKLVLYTFAEFGMAFFAILHFALTAYFLVLLFKWLKTDHFKQLFENPLTSSAIFAPFISVTMTMNVMLAAVRYFVPVLAQNLQAMMIPGLIAWFIIWIFLMRTEIKVLKNSFIRGFDIDSINFGWLMQSFALAMLTVTGTGIAAMAQAKWVADTAFFLSLIPGTMAVFLFAVKMIAIFKSQFKREGLPERQFLPSILIIVPTVTVLTIALFRIGHYLEVQHGAHFVTYSMLVVTIAFALETWYLMFGLSLLADYAKNNLMKEFHVSQWGLICPFVAYTVLASFLYKVFATNIFVLVLIVVMLVFISGLYLFILAKQYTCARSLENPKIKKSISCA